MIKAVKAIKYGNMKLKSLFESVELKDEIKVITTHHLYPFSFNSECLLFAFRTVKLTL